MIKFQCSSASRKFLIDISQRYLELALRFSALQRAENSSIRRCGCSRWRWSVSVLFSEPKIPQFRRRAALLMWSVVSVLFSEPKIPHSASGRARYSAPEFQCSSASRKFLITLLAQRLCKFAGFSALQRAENSSINTLLAALRLRLGFSALQRAENSSIRPTRLTVCRCSAVSVLFSEPKIPPARTARARTR